MKNKLFATLMATVVMTVTLTGCGTEVAITGGNQQAVTSEVEKSVVTTGSYSEEDINAAKEMALAYFEENFKDCELMELYYDEAFSVESSEVWAEQYDTDEAMVLLSSFAVSENCENFALNPGETYEDYSWVFTRNKGEEWVLQTCGY